MHGIKNSTLLQTSLHEGKWHICFADLSIFIGTGANGQIYIAISRVENGMEDNAVAGVNNTRFNRGGKNSIKCASCTCPAAWKLLHNARHKLLAINPTPSL